MRNIWIWGVLAVVVIGGGFWFLQTSQSSTPANSEATEYGTSANAGTDVSTTNPGANAPTTATVTYNGAGFSPSSVTVAKGGTVTFTSTAGSMWVASAQHPTHTAYSGTTLQQHCPDASDTAFDQCAPGTSYSFTFQKAGTWNYHNHLNPEYFGTVIVQ